MVTFYRLAELSQKNQFNLVSKRQEVRYIYTQNSLWIGCETKCLKSNNKY